MLVLGVLSTLKLGRLVVQNDEVSSSDIESRQMIDRRLGIKNVLVDDEGRSPCVPPIAQSDLVDGAVFAKYSVKFLGGYFERKIPNV